MASTERSCTADTLQRAARQSEQGVTGPTAPLIGLVGGIASGKSLVADAFRALGATVLDADRMGHEVLQMPEVRAALRSRWGDRVLDQAGRVRREQVAAIVFAEGSGGQERAFLESVTHPRIRCRLQTELEQVADQRRPVILDAPLLIEAGWDCFCDRIVFVDSPAAARRERACARGWKAEDWQAREAAQLPLDVKRQRADWVIENGGTPDDTRRQVAELWHRWTAPAAPSDSLHN